MLASLGCRGQQNPEFIGDDSIIQVLSFEMEHCAKCNEDDQLPKTAQRNLDMIVRMSILLPLAALLAASVARAQSLAHRLPVALEEHRLPVLHD